MLDNANSQGPAGPALIHFALSPITTEFEVLWRPSGYALITRQKSLGRNHPFLKGESPSVIQSLPFSLPTAKSPVLSNASIFQHGKSMRCHVIQKNTAPVVLGIDDYQPRLGSAGNLGLQAALPSTHRLILGQQLPVKAPCGRDAPLKSALALILPGPSFPWAQVRPGHLSGACR